MGIQLILKASSSGVGRALLISMSDIQVLNPVSFVSVKESFFAAVLFTLFLSLSSSSQMKKQPEVCLEKKNGLCISFHSLAADLGFFLNVFFNE